LHVERWRGKLRFEAATPRRSAAMTAETVSTANAAPTAVHIGKDELPFVEIGGGNKLKVIQVDEPNALWIVENIFQAGFEVQTHKHTGPVYGYTTSGAWKYKEYEYVNRAGSFLYEPAGSVHTLTCIEDNTQVWFQMYGVNLNLDENGNIDSVSDGAGSLAAYLAMCEAQGFGRPDVLIG
jgi:quercetin dioxygenase-like cupin family protein